MVTLGLVDESAMLNSLLFSSCSWSGSISDGFVPSSFVSAGQFTELCSPSSCGGFRVEMLWKGAVSKRFRGRRAAGLTSRRRLLVNSESQVQGFVKGL
jgi:hypothetical protein